MDVQKARDSAVSAKSLRSVQIPAPVYSSIARLHSVAEWLMHITIWAQQSRISEPEQSFTPAPPRTQNHHRASPRSRCLSGCPAQRSSERASRQPPPCEKVDCCSTDEYGSTSDSTNSVTRSAAALSLLSRRGTVPACRVARCVEMKPPNLSEAQQAGHGGLYTDGFK